MIRASVTLSTITLALDSTNTLMSVLQLTQRTNHPLRIRSIVLVCRHIHDNHLVQQSHEALISDLSHVPTGCAISSHDKHTQRTSMARSVKETPSISPFKAFGSSGFFGFLAILINPRKEQAGLILLLG